MEVLNLDYLPDGHEGTVVPINAKAALNTVIEVKSVDAESPKKTREPGFIDQGVQYKVYELGKGKVRKVPQSYADTLSIFNNWDEDPAEAKSKTELALKDRREAEEGVKKLLRKAPDISGWLANPEFDVDGSHKQDKVKVLHNLLEGADFETAQQLIDNYFDTVLSLWTFGISDKVFNFGLNYGLDEVGDVVLLDFGEITFNIDEAAKLIEDEKWQKAWSVRNLPDETRNYFMEEAKKRLTKERLKNLWGSSLKK